MKEVPVHLYVAEIKKVHVMTGKTVTNQKYIHKNINSILNLKKKLNIEIHKQ